MSITPSLHNPVRGENESQADYRKRRTISNAHARPARWLHRNPGRGSRGDGTYTAPSERITRRLGVAAIGIRQYKRERASWEHGLGRYPF